MVHVCIIHICTHTNEACFTLFSESSSCFMWQGVVLGSFITDLGVLCMLYSLAWFAQNLSECWIFLCHASLDSCDPSMKPFFSGTWPTVVEGIPFSLLPSLVGNCVPLRVVHDLCLEVLPVGPRGLRNNQYMIFHSAGPFWDPDLLLGQEAFPGNITEPPPATIWLLCSF